MGDQERTAPETVPVRPTPSDERDAVALAGVDEALRALPELAVPDDVWTSVRGRIDATPSRRPGRRLLPLAAAASVVVGVAAGLFVSRSSPAVATAATADRNIAALLERSRVVEAERRVMPMALAPSGVERVLQVRIGGIDALLNEQLLLDTDLGARQALLSERVELMEDLRHIERYRRDELFLRAMY